MHEKGKIGLTALEVISSINTLVRLLGELRASKDATCGITTVTQDVPLPFVDVTLVWGLAGAVGERSTLSIAFVVGRLANTLSAPGSVTVVAGETTRIVPGTDQGCVVRAAAVSSLGRYLRAPMVAQC